ncbi:reverse transcriptase domain-containing protein [Tanacetum coccineum]
MSENIQEDESKDDFEELPPEDELRIKKSIQDPTTDLEMKPLPKHLEYAFLEENSHLLVVISALLEQNEKERLVSVLKNYKESFAWKTSDIPGISPSFCKHKINLEDDVKPVIKRQRRLNSNMKEVVEKEIIKLLDAGIFKFPSNQPIKKRPLSLALMEPTPISDMLETSMEVFMDDFSVFGDSIDSCLNNLEQMLIRCKQVHLVLNWEKCQFMVTEGIMLGHKVSHKGLEVDKAKIDVIAKLPPPTKVKVVRSFLGHAGFYRRFIKDFSKISRPMTKLLEKDSVFNFDEECNKAFETLKEKLTNSPIMVSPNWSLPFELMCDASDFTIGSVLSQPDHLSRLEKPNLNNEEINDEFPDEFLMSIKMDEEESSWFANSTNYLVRGILRKGLTYAQRYECHHGPTGGHYGPSINAKKVFDAGFYWPSIFKEAQTLVQNCDACQCSGSISRRDEMPLNNIQLLELDEFRLQAYENSKLYKARTKAYHDKKLRVRKEFQAEDKVLLYNSKYVELYDKHRGSFIVNGHRVKLYHNEEQLNELAIEEIHLMCEDGRMKAIPFMGPFLANYRETMPWA